jgi:hypothetical protein
MPLAPFLITRLPAADYCHAILLIIAIAAIFPLLLRYFAIFADIFLYYAADYYFSLCCRLSLSLPFATFSPFFIAADAAFHFRLMIARYFAAILLKRRAAPPALPFYFAFCRIFATARHAIAARHAMPMRA